MDEQGASQLTIAVLAGGDSAEREISLRSGAAVEAALLEAGHRAVTIDPAHQEIDSVDWIPFDACFVALHGGAGEDGRVQQALERLGVPYTGSGPAASRLAMSKSASKERFAECGVPTPPHIVIESDDPPGVLERRAATLGYPLVVKPDAQGSSIGVTPVDHPVQLLAAARAAAQFDGLAIAESMVIGREFTVAVIDRRALPLVEIVTPERVFSYQAKYDSTLTEYRLDFELPPRKRVEIARAAIAATTAIGTTGLARVDVLLGHDQRVWVLEVNTVPGMTACSLAPLAAARAGFDMAALCDLLARQCLAGASIS